MTGMEGSSADSKETTRKPGRAGQDTPAAEERGGVPQQEGESTCKVRAKSMRREDRSLSQHVSSGRCLSER